MPRGAWDGEEFLRHILPHLVATDIAPQVAQYVGMDWPDGLEQIAETTGREVQVKVKHTTSKDGKVYANVYIAPPRKGRKEVDAATAKRLISRLADDASEVPF